MSNVRHIVKRVAGLVAALAASVGAHAGGPLVLLNDGTPAVWGTGSPISYRTDNGPLSATVGQAAAQGRVADMFEVWEDVASATISYTRAGFIQDTGAFSDGDVSTITEYDAVQGSCANGSQSPVVYDSNAAIFDALGLDPEFVIGFAGPCAVNGAGVIVSGEAVMNGLFQDGTSGTGNPADLTAAEFDATFIHEFGHFSGLDHSQINVGCADGACGANQLAGLPTMFPFLVSSSQGSLSVDDVAWISKLYPAAGGSGFNATHGHVTGTIFFSDGESHAQGVNVIARLVGDGLTTAASNVSGYRFRFFLGNPINDAGDNSGSTDPADIGFYEIPLPPGTYTIDVESIDPAFEGGSSVGGPVRIDMPGTSPGPIGPVTVTAGDTSSGNDITLVGTAPRFDQFEGP